MRTYEPAEEELPHEFIGKDMFFFLFGMSLKYYVGGAYALLAATVGYGFCESLLLFASEETEAVYGELIGKIGLFVMSGIGVAAVTDGLTLLVS